MLFRFKQTFYLLKASATALILLTLIVGCSSSYKLSSKNRIPNSFKDLRITINSNKETFCFKGNKKHTVSIKIQKESCKVIQETNGVSEKITHSSSGNEYCFEVSSRIIKDFKENGFSCTSYD